MTNDKDARIAALEAQLAEKAAVAVKVEALDDLPPNESVGAYGQSGQWLEICTVGELRTTLEATPPAPKVTDAMVEAGAKAAAARWGRTAIWEEDVAIVRAILTAAQEAGK